MRCRLWFIGRLQTDADRERVLDGLSQELPAMVFDHTVQRLGPRWFVVRNAYAPSAPVLLKPRQTMTLLRGPMMRSEIRKAREWRARMEAGVGPQACATQRLIMARAATPVNEV